MRRENSRKTRGIINKSNIKNLTHFSRVNLFNVYINLETSIIYIQGQKYLKGRADGSHEKQLCLDLPADFSLAIDCDCESYLAFSFLLRMIGYQIYCIHVPTFDCYKISN